MADIQYGGTSLPLAPGAATQHSLLQAADPALYWALQYWAAMLEKYVGAAAVSEGLAVRAPIGQAVASTLPYDPQPFFTESVQFVPPALAVYRVQGTFVPRSAVWRQMQSEWEIAYILPALSAGAAVRLLPLLQAAGRVLDDTTDRKGDPGWMGGANPFGDGYGNVSRIGFTSYRLGRYDDDTGRAYHAWIGRCAVAERVMPLPPLGAPMAMAATVTQAQPDGTDATGFDDVQGQAP